MKKIIFVIGVCALVIDAWAATKCVAASKLMWCYYVQGTGAFEGTVSCSVLGSQEKFVAQIMFACSNQEAWLGEMGVGSDTLTASSDPAENQYCWARMVSPVMSRWVYTSYSPGGLCDAYCGKSMSMFEMVDDEGGFTLFF